MQTLTISDKYIYLGLTFSKNGSLCEAVQNLKEKGYKALFQMSSSLYTGLTFTPDIPLKIFDSTVRPILTYGCEAWASDYAKLLIKPNQLDKAPFEQINNKFCKYVLGVSSRASNFAVKAELGREPIFAFICSQALKYWTRILNMSQDRLVKSAYLSELEIHAAGGHSWASFIASLLKLINVDHMWDAPDSLEPSKQSTMLKNKIRTTYRNWYFDHNFAIVGQQSKLRSYVDFKDNHHMENYLKVEDVPYSWRKLYCNFRISCHDLEIERGRYCRPQKPPEKRICQVCKIESETEQHFILSCPAYAEIRKQLFKEIRTYNLTILSMNHADRFRYLLSSQETFIIKNVMKFISAAHIKRQDILSGKM